VREKEFKLWPGWNGQLTLVSCWWSEGSGHAIGQSVKSEGKWQCWGYTNVG